ncbi:hypothetical protein HPP92_016692 [Vanilla planifolia]|uniref:Uncharacterized protein n=1 Tax=Vanilla planifolia TaxID=51239 RepID=A0A835QLN8_VANPL|nr:hypothetical protein HPP92_016692 [Vanilla planifolia]
MMVLAKLSDGFNKHEGDASDKDNRDDFDKADKCVMLGYLVNGYCCLDLQSGRLFGPIIHSALSICSPNNSSYIVIPLSSNSLFASSTFPLVVTSPHPLLLSILELTAHSPLDSLHTSPLVYSFEAATSPSASPVQPPLLHHFSECIPTLCICIPTTCNCI